MQIKISLLQTHPRIGDINFNRNKIIDFYLKNQDKDLIVTPELALTGYSPMDNLYNSDFIDKTKECVEEIRLITKNKKSTLILGAPLFEESKIYNVALVIQNGKIIHTIYKNILANYSIFNESRYFHSKSNPSNILNIKGYKVALLICEDAWHKEVCSNIIDQKPDLIIIINASIFERNKNKLRNNILTNNFKNLNKPIIYLNQVGLLDGTILDGNSFILDKNHKIITHMKNMEEDAIEVLFNNDTITTNTNNILSENDLELFYDAMIFGLRNFMQAVKMKKVVLGLSGGLDSAITAAIARDAIGEENITVVSMPSKHTSNLSKDIINQMVNELNLNFIEIPIDDLTESTLKNLHGVINPNINNTKENIQARIRAQILMAFVNNNHEYLLLTTGNKSENATGYCTLYGDTCGGYNLIKDIYKTEIFQLAKWRNNNIPSKSLYKDHNIIPNLVIERKPSAELSDNQYDEDNLMPYEILDKILFAFIEEKKSFTELEKTFDITLLKKAINLVKKAQYKRIQTPLGVKLSTRDFNKDFQYLLTDEFINTK